MNNQGIFMKFRNILRQSAAQSDGNLALKTAVKNWKNYHGTKWEHAKNIFSEKLRILSKQLADQCNFIACHRLRRTAQIFNLYSRIYDERTIKYVIEKFGHTFLRNGKTKPIYMLFGASIFQWDQKSITDSEIESVTEDMNHVTHLKDRSADAHYMDSWESLIDRPHLKAWRKAIPETCLYEYKIYGTYNDVPARAFYDVNLDLEFRKHWDNLVIKLECIEEDRKSGQEVIHWVVHYPYPMYSREYVYVRRRNIDVENKVMVIVNQATDHPSYPETNSYVRVHRYFSKIVIKPHTTFDENGFDYVMTYSDDPKTSLPSITYNWMASTGVPDYVDKLHSAAKQLHEKPWLKRTGKFYDEENKTEVPAYQ
ncbi:unnamed protein product [Owenia fusiformis]|uniref:Phosphatidylcholine transfer protein n=1 Tax=Owenia fusiformis TaxID=6347 RepID=A0A8J1T5T8_OWEFU|nr:unnamed protein product [Owenia fusiformis]